MKRSNSSATAPGERRTRHSQAWQGLRRATAGGQAEQLLAVNAISPGLVKTPGTEFLGITNEHTRDRESPVEMIAEAVCHIARSEPKRITGRIDHIPEFLQDFQLEPVPLI